MTEERFSKLQKSILRRCFQEGKSFIERQALLKEYIENMKIDLNSAEVTLTKSLRNLRDKGYVELEDTGCNPVFTREEIEELGLGEILDGTKAKYVSLTEEGVKRAREIILRGDNKT